jgi:hypothetical protein
MRKIMKRLAREVKGNYESGLETWRDCVHVVEGEQSQRPGIPLQLFFIGSNEPSPTATCCQTLAS